MHNLLNKSKIPFYFFIWFFAATLSSRVQAAIDVEKISGKDIISEKPLQLSAKSKKYSVFYFLNSLCPCSQAHYDHLNELKRQYPQYNFVAFNSNKTTSYKDTKSYYDQYKVEFPVIFDNHLVYANIFKAVKTPHVFVLDQKGEIVFQGGATNSRDPKKATKFYLKDALNSISQGQSVATKDAKTIGCYIVR